MASSPLFAGARQVSDIAQTRCIQLDRFASVTGGLWTRFAFW